MRSSVLFKFTQNKIWNSLYLLSLKLMEGRLKFCCHQSIVLQHCLEQQVKMATAEIKTPNKTLDCSVSARPAQSKSLEALRSQIDLKRCFQLSGHGCSVQITHPKLWELPDELHGSTLCSLWFLPHLLQLCRRVIVDHKTSPDLRVGGWWLHF